MATATTKQAVAQAVPVAQAAELTINPNTRPAYLVAGVDESTGEETWTNRFRYLPGHPRQVRFDAKAGQFNIGGTVPLGSSLSFIPLAWRVFQDDILNMGRKLWAELFFADDKGAVCAVLFHGYSVENLYRLIEPLFYDDLTLADVTVKVTAEKKQTTKDGKTATYYIAQFSYEAADAAQVAARRDYARDFPIWRAETYTGAADMRIQHGYTVPAEDDPQGPEPAAAEPATLPQAA
ncbi:hypothetical protein Q3A66_16305 [Hymenobacter sp. BT770]|uniref:hypothetical protein n=1 Tax=Hymenobacter sp. BT770 TaxID=2886942 RepID=UPI001D116169|nr:hypothetical protein [Hymenobacter sp. BT770]MCC3154578.1 hypothetical protein [Hymenobacter sp. BT770]MDO3416632.1 hypothetical protein [Hymenobacter sp. BT770]